MYSGNCFVKGVFQLTIFYKICKTDFTVALPVALQNNNNAKGAEYIKNRYIFLNKYAFTMKIRLQNLNLYYIMYIIF